MHTLLNDADAFTARNTLGMTNVGQNLVTSPTNSIARIYLGVGSNGDALFTSPSSANSRAVLGIVSANDTTEGLAQRATDTEVVSGINDTKFLTPKKLKLGFSISLGVVGWIDFPSWLGGLQIRWGRYTAGKNSNTVVNFPRPFSSQCFGLNNSFAEIIGRGDVSLSYGSLDINGFAANYHRDGSGGSGVQCFYTAFGY